MAEFNVLRGAHCVCERERLQGGRRGYEVVRISLSYLRRSDPRRKQW